MDTTSEHSRYAARLKEFELGRRRLEIGNHQIGFDALKTEPNGGFTLAIG